MKAKRRTMKEMRELVDNEGLGYAIQCYCDADSVPKKLEKDWAEAARLLNKIEKEIFGDEV